MATHAHSMPTGGHFLRRAKVEALAGAGIGVVVAAAAGPLARASGIPSPLGIAAFGIALLVAALVLVAIARRERIDLRAVVAFISADLLWIAGSAAVLVANVLPLTATGWWMIVLLALLVADFAFAKLWGLRRMR